LADYEGFHDVSAEPAGSPYDAIAQLYDPWSRSVTEDLSFYAEVALESGGGPVVELGIGTGRIAVPIASFGIRVIGVDSSLEMLRVCRQRAERAGVAELLETARSLAPEPVVETSPEGTRVAIIGRPNVGKSSLVNAVLGEERVLVHEAPGTTRDSVDTPLTFRDRRYLLIDTAGIRRKGRVTEVLEKLAVVMALKSLERCDVAVLVMDASEGVTSQDAHIAGYAHDAGRAIVLAVNKWDLVPPGLVGRAEVTAQIHERLPFLDYAPICFTSAVTKLGLRDLFDTVDQVAAEARKRLQPAELLTIFRQALERRPTSSGGVPIRVHSVQQVAVSPPTFAVKVNASGKLHFSYERYLINSIRHAAGFAGSPIRLLVRRSAAKRKGTSGSQPNRGPSHRRS